MSGVGGGAPGFLRNFHAEGFDPQPPFDVAVVIPSILRPSLAEALRSVFGQRFPGRIQVLVGVDQLDAPAEPTAAATSGEALVAEACAAIPPHCMVQLLWPGYSTSVRHGGLGRARDGGMLRAVLTLLANANAVAYLDDDNVMGVDHLRTLREALADHDYAFSLRWFAHHETMRPVCVDVWESVGPDAGIFKESFGGFVDPNTLMIDRERCLDTVVAWTTPLPRDEKAMSADRMVFARLRRLRGAGTGQATTLYRLDPKDGLHPVRLRIMGDAYTAEDGTAPPDQDVASR